MSLLKALSLDSLSSSRSSRSQDHSMVLCTTSRPIRAWSAPGIWYLTTLQQAEAAPQLICFIQAASSPSFPPCLAGTYHMGAIQSHNHRTFMPLRHPGGSQPALGCCCSRRVPIGHTCHPAASPQTCPSCNAISCGTGHLSFGQLDPTCDLSLEAAGNGPALPGMSWLSWRQRASWRAYQQVGLTGSSLSLSYMNVGTQPLLPVNHPADIHQYTRLHKTSQILKHESPSEWAPALSPLLFPLNIPAPWKYSPFLLFAISLKETICIYPGECLVACVIFFEIIIFKEF